LIVNIRVLNYRPKFKDTGGVLMLRAAAGPLDSRPTGAVVQGGLLNPFFFVSDFVFVHGMANALGEDDINEGFTPQTHASYACIFR
jgi:hypothetical protein